MKTKSTISKMSLAAKILFHVMLVLYGLMAIANPILLGNASQINSMLGIEVQVGGSGSNGNMYFDTQYKNVAEMRQASLDVIEETVAQGAVLLKNDNNALPLSKDDTVSMYGFASYFTVHTGQGSSGVDKSSSDGSPDALADRVTMYDGLKNAGLDMNEELYNWYKSKSEDDFVVDTGNKGRFIGSMGQETQLVVNDASWSQLPLAKNNSARAAVMVLARTGGEAEDLYMDTTMDDGATRVIVSKKHHGEAANSVGDALRLSENEADVLLNLKSLKEQGKIDKIIVLMNSASPLECDFLQSEDYDIDACMWVGTVGTNGANAVGKLLVGTYNPSGRTTDTFWRQSKYNPVYYNFGSIRYDNAEALTASYFATMGYQNHKYYVAYQEGIYNGYRYTETRYEDVVTGRENAGNFVYSDAVSYPFGYGLSYSTFTYSDMSVTYEAKSDSYVVKLNVTNTSSVDGKEAVQVYLQKPYTDKDVANGVEKPSAELVGFAKVFVAAGQKERVEIKVSRKYFASYDSNVEKTYVVGTDGDEEYLLTAAKNAHDATNNFIAYKQSKGVVTVDESLLYSDPSCGKGGSQNVWGTHIDYDNTTYSTNDFIKSENGSFAAAYDGQKANYGVDKITNQFDDADFAKAGLFTDGEAAQRYMSRSDWTGTYGKRITLTANDKLKQAQASPSVEKDDVPYPTYGEIGFYQGADVFDEIKLIYLRGKDYNDPYWDILLDRMTFEETCQLLQNGLRFTSAVPSIAAPSTSQQNGAVAPNHQRSYTQLPSQSGFRGFAEKLDPDNKDSKPPVFACNGLVAATFDVELIQKIGEQTGEEAAWAGYNGIYGLGVNIHRGAYCGRTFEYYSEDGFLTGVAAGYEAVGLHKKGVFVLMKHAVLNDQETHRAGLNVWANEQTIREVYLRAFEVAVEIDNANTQNSVLGVMTGMNRLGAKWSGGQGFCNTVLKAEFGMRGYVISDYNSSRLYMSPIQGVLNGNDLPDGDPAGNGGGKDYDGNSIVFADYAEGYGNLAWSMRSAAKSILYTIVNSNAMNGIDGDSSFKIITPLWEKMIPVLTRVFLTLFIWSAVAYVVITIVTVVKQIGKSRQHLKTNGVAEENKNE